MEILAFIESAVSYEDPSPAPQLRSCVELGELLAQSSVGLAATAVTVSVLTAAPEAQAVVLIGDVCPAVREVQTALTTEGFAPGGIDGVFGAGTEAAVIEFQRSAGLTADGIVGPSTAAELGIGDLDDSSSPFLVGNTCVSDGGGGGGDDEEEATTATVTTEGGFGINTRSSPNGSIVGGLPEGATVGLTGTYRTAGGFEWAELDDGTWVATDFLDIEDGAGGGGGDGEVTSATVTTGVNVRSTPNGAVVGGLAEGATVDLTGTYRTAGGFEWAELDDGTWVATDFLDIEDGAGGGGGDGEVTSATVTTGVNVRSTPNGAVVGGLAEGATVDLTGTYRTAGGFEWAELDDGTWVAVDFLDIDGSTGGGGGSTEAVISTPSGFGVNVRNTPNGTITGGLAEGAEVVLTGEYVFSGGFEWAELEDGSWVAVDFLDFA